MTGASVTIKTGVQGSGKTCSAVSELAALLTRWDEHPEERRPVFVHGIRGLLLDHAALPVYPLRGKPGDEYQKDRVGQPSEPVAVDWAQVPQGAHVVIDEAQRLFPPRPNNAPVPAHVAWFAMSRQEGCTVVLMTQAGTSVDVEVRKRCGLHQHYEARPFGIVTVKEWTNQVSTTYRGAETTRAWRVDKQAFSLYTSAALHTKGAKAKIPLPVFLVAGAVLAGVVALPFAGKVMWGAMHGKGVTGTTSAAGALVPSAAASSSPFLSVVPASGAVVAGAASQPARPVYAGCISIGAQCRCLDAEGYTVPDIDPQVCHRSAREYGELVPYPVRVNPGGGGQGVAVSSAAPQSGSDAVRTAMGNLGVQVTTLGSPSVRPGVDGSAYGGGHVGGVSSSGPAGFAR